MALKNFQDKMNSAGVKKTDIVKTTVFLTSMGDYGAVNKMYSRFFEGHKPARSCVAVKELPRGAVFEIEAIGVELRPMRPKL